MTLTNNDFGIYRKLLSKFEAFTIFPKLEGEVVFIFIFFIFIIVYTSWVQFGHN